MAVILDSLQVTQQFATRVAKKLRRGDIVLLQGDLGMGKTTFAQYLIRAISPTPVDVTSPTFNLLQTYPVLLAGEAGELWHYDLYRIEHPAELGELGMEEAFEHGVTLIEWPERMGDALPPHYVMIALSPEPLGQGRLASITAKGDGADRWRNLDATA